MIYQCPLCSQILNQEEYLYHCPNNHQFDIAKEGYVNLIPANKKRSKHPGDNADMMQARRRFLDNQHYARLRDRVTKLCIENLTHHNLSLSKTNYRILDIGCGEGYYTSKLESEFRKHSRPSQIYGLDISKVAIRYAAKKYPLCHFSVASSQRLPFLDKSLDLILRIYAPCHPQEMARCIQSNGLVVTVTPGSRHLYQLRELIYEDVRLHSKDAEIITNFQLEHEEEISYSMVLKNTDPLDLLQMTPFFWKATDPIKQQLASSDGFCCEANFMIRVYRKIDLINK